MLSTWQELQYAVDGDDVAPAMSNRFSGDWIALHMMSTVCRLTDQRNASYQFLRNGGMAFAKTLSALKADDLASAARVVDPSSGDSMQQLLQNTSVPKTVKDALQAMQSASATVLGTDGHRRQCRHEGVAYMETFGPPLIFLTPNLADTQHPLLLVVQGEEVDLGSVDQEMDPSLPKYRDMLRKIAQDPVAQTVQFEFLMRLFFQHVLNVRPETLDCRRGGVRTVSREWCSDGAAASSTGAGMLGPVLAFRGEIEAQGRGSLHPHILVWLVCGHLEVVGQLASMLKNNKAELQHRLRHFMKMVVASFESLSHASVQAAPRIVDGASLSTPVSVTKVARNLSKYDGGSDLDLLREMLERTPEQDAFLEAAQDDDWRRPLLQVEEAPNPTKNIFTQPINGLPVAQTPAYRLRSVLVEGASPEEEARAWQTAFAQAALRITFTHVFDVVGFFKEIKMSCRCVTWRCLM